MTIQSLVRMSAVVAVFATLTGRAVAQDHYALDKAFIDMRAPLATMAQLNAQSQTPSEQFGPGAGSFGDLFKRNVLPVVLKQGVRMTEPNSSQVKYRFEDRRIDPEDGHVYFYQVTVAGNLYADGSFAMTGSHMMVERTKGKEGEAGWSVSTHYFETDLTGAPLKRESEYRERLSDGSLKEYPRKKDLPGVTKTLIFFTEAVDRFARLFTR